ncbi:MAG: beta-aspartyl-peptidase [Pseudomonadota bacterium]
MIHLIKNAQIYAPEPLGLGHVLIAGGRIAYVGQDLPEIGSSLLASSIDAQGAALIPGLIDIHSHLTGGGGEAGFATQVPPVPLTNFTKAGVTSVVGLLGTDDITRSTDSLVARTRALREEGLSAWCWTGGYHWPATTLTGSVTRDIVSIDVIVGLGELAISDHRSSQMTDAELARAAGEAHVAGLMTGKAGVCHLHLGDGEAGLEMVRRALKQTEIPARVFNPTHCNRKLTLFDEACEITKEGCYIDITAFPVEEGEDGLEADDALIQYLERGHDPSRITISTDSGGCLACFDENGLPHGLDYGRADDLALALSKSAKAVGLDRALPAFTRNPAELMRFHAKGRVAEGMDADIVLMDEDFGIASVMALGEWMIQDRDVKKRGTFE